MFDSQSGYSTALLKPLIKIITTPISRAQLQALARDGFGDMVKAVIDVSRRTMAIGGELHADEESVLLENGSMQADLWGINLYPSLRGDEMVEFDSMINVRPRQGNRSRSVEDPGVRGAILVLVRTLVTE